MVFEGINEVFQADAAFFVDIACFVCDSRVFDKTAAYLGGAVCREGADMYIYRRLSCR